MSQEDRWVFFKRNSGLQARIAAQAYVDRSVVSKVLNGKATSAKVRKALEGELRKLRQERARLAQEAS